MNRAFLEKILNKKIRHLEIKKQGNLFQGKARVLSYHIFYKDGMEDILYSKQGDLRGLKKTYEITKALEKFGFIDREKEVPAPLFFDQSKKFLLYRAILGRFLLGVVAKEEKPIQNITYTLRLVAKFLWHFHQFSHFPKLPQFTFLSFQNEIKSMQSRLAKVYPERTELLNKRFLEVSESFEHFSQEENYPIHGDFNPSNIILTEENSIGVIDFSDSMLFHPGLDLGSFLGVLDFLEADRNLPGGWIEKWSKEFLKDYFQLNKKEFNYRPFRLWTNLKNIYVVIGVGGRAVHTLALAEKLMEIIERER